jgi:hypothetical protein
MKGKALAKKYTTTTSTIRKWHMNKSKLLQCVNDPDVSTKLARRLEGCGRKHEHGELETLLITWIKDRLRLRIKNKYIALKSRELGNKIGLCDPVSTSSFKASTGSIENFKKLNRLISRRQTSSRQIQSNADDLCRHFHRLFLEISRIY